MRLSIGIFLYLCIAGTDTHAQACVTNTGNSAVITIPKSVGDQAGMLEGDLFRAWNDSLCVGEVRYSFNEGQTGIALTVWGDDTLTPEVDGMSAGKTIRYSLFRPATDSTFEDIVVSYLIGDGIYAPGAIMQIASMSINGGMPVAVESAEIPESGSLSKAFPNPFVNFTHLNLRLTRPGPVIIEMFDALGRRVRSVFNGEMAAGKREVNISANGLASGVYLIRVRTKSFLSSRSVVLVR